jgi:hypothetical protein
VGKKENSRRKDNFPPEDPRQQLFDNISLSSSPRRSWSWNYAGDHANVASKPEDRRVRGVAKDPETLGFSRTPGIRTVSQTSELSVLDQVAEHVSDGTTGDANDSRDVEDADETAEHVDCRQARAPLVPIIEAPDRPEIGRPSSPFKRWLRTLKQRHRALDDDLAPLSRLEKSPSSTSSVAFISAVRTASVTIASFSVHPRSRRSAQTSYLRHGGSQADMRYRSSFDGEDVPESPLIDDGTWSRSVRRHRIVEEIVSSEESYVRDLRTLINVSVEALF